MAFEPGGYADKLGNRYEGRWVARQLLLLLNEQIRSVTLESVGDDEAGVDLWIERDGDLREAQQCKAENGTKSHWSLADLKRRGVLDHLWMQLERDPGYEFTLVSGSPATQLRDLSRSARDSTGDPESFYRDQIQAGSEDRQSGFSEWCVRLGLQESVTDDRAVAFDLLRRSGFHIFVDTRESREELRCMARQAVIGDSDSVIALLADYAVDNLRKAISVVDITRHLRKSGYEPRQLFADERIRPRLDELQEDFDDSIRPHFAGGRSITRPEVDDVLKALDGESIPDAVVLHGSAGRGKSGVLYQLTEKLREQDTPFLALRLDRKTPVGSPRQFGESLGLRESPVNCLTAISGGKRAVLILDQLDALRWTSSHSTEGLEVCKGLLREARSLQLFGGRISIVLCCRTFDLEHDPQIRAWLKPTKSFTVEKVAVKELPEASVREFVKSFGVSFERMTARRRTLLRSVQNLAIWAEVAQSEETSPEFDSGTDLMRMFLDSRCSEIERAGFSTYEREDVIGKIVDFMESNATLAAPRRLIDMHKELVAKLQSLNLIHATKRTVSFCHQSYLDFLIASRVADQLASGPEAVIEWLGDRSEQSLFRREQLRQLLFLMAEDDPDRLSNAFERILSSDDVRFHIKQLAVEAIGQLKPTTALINFVIGLTESDDWRRHVLHDVLHGSGDWISAFHDRGRLFEWLLSSDESLANGAVWLLISVAGAMPSLLSEALQATLPDSKQDLLRGVLHYSKACSEADEVFEFRLQCLRDDTDPPYISWKEVAAERPDRAIQLVAAFLDNRPSGRRAKRANHRLEMDGGDDLKAMTRAARRCSKLTVRLLTPILTTVASQKIAEHRAWKNGANSDSPASYPDTRYPKVLLRLMIAAVRSLARKSPQRFQKLSIQLSGISSRAVQAMLIRGWTAMPAGSADDAVAWLLSGQRRLRCGSEKKKPRWCAAAALIERMSPHCSDAVFAGLERTLLKYRDPNEKRLASYWLEQTRDGYFRNEFFAAQRFLLPALDDKRRSQETAGRIGCLIRKLGRDADSQFIRPKARGGFVGSTLNATNRISDRQWLRLISNKEVAGRESRRRMRYRPDGGPMESSIEMFARDFGGAAKTESERFARLVQRLPEDAPPEYVSQVFSAFAEAPRSDGNPAAGISAETIESTIDSVPLHAERNWAMQFLWLLRKRSDINHSNRILNHVISLTRHADPLATDLCDDDEPFEIENRAINRVRSMAAIVLGVILYDHQERFELFRPVLEPLLEDPHPAVREAMIEVCLPVWNIDRELAVRWFLKAAYNDLRPACSHEAQRFLNHGFGEYADELSPLIHDMCRSQNPKVAQEGAMEATARWLFHGVFSDLVQACRSGTEPQRIGVASVAAEFVRDVQYADRCWPILLELCNDPSSEVREKAGHALHDERVLGTATSPESLQTFVGTQAFEDDPDCLIDALQDHPGSLIPFADLVCDTVTKSIEIIRDPDRKPDRRIPMIDRHLSTVLLRLYEQAGDTEHANIRDRCLDMFDKLLQHRITSAKSLLDEIEG